MTVEELRQRIEAIRVEKGDDEVQHSLEKALWRDVLIAIADGTENHRQLAAVALETRDIVFSRWYA